MMVRSTALSMIGIFIPIFLYRLNYSIPQILSVYGMYFTTRVALDFIAGYVTARIGPKHTLVYGQLLLIISNVLFMVLPIFHISVLIAGAVWGASASFFFIPFHTDFSKIKHKTHGGKEIGFEQIMEKVGLILGPLVGGAVASIFGSKYIFLVSIFLLIAGLWPLFQTKEPTRLKQKLDLKGFPAHDIVKHIPGYIGLNIENTLCLMLWPFYLAVVVIPTSSVLIKVGLISSAAVLASIASSYAVGKTVDNNKGRSLLRISAVSNGFIHLLRPFVTLYPVAFAVNIANEVVTIGYRLPFTKGIYDTADDFPGHRIVFICSMEVIGCISKAFAWWLLFLLSFVLPVRVLFFVGFFIAGAGSILITSEKYQSLNPKVVTNG
jgi:MFS family permease